ncbi:MAG TPA: gephyrin-like molybdotransferase Glp [Candidatus Eisenbacteria bacterium]|nr:gephyrin-like molybdotransferase Glp [Candidatus Eisenbacteria bacterium]
MASGAAAEPRLLSYDDARARVLNAVRPLAPERVPLGRALGRALREPVVAPHALPPFRNSSMDGFALRAGDAAAGARLRVIETIAAGQAPARALAPGDAARIMTGAILPAGADAVAPFEECASEAGEARPARAFRPGENVREAGADLAAGAIALEPGRALSAYDLALLAALGIPEVAVGPAPRVSIVSTGDELLEPTEPLRPGAIRDSNRLQLALRVAAAGGELVRAVRVGDRPQAVADAIRAALADSDAVLTIGGVSAGDFDPVKQSLGALGDVELWRVAMKPGRPQAFGTPGGRVFYGLPGNPASVACVFEVLAAPALRKLQGHSALDLPRVHVRAAERIESRAGRTDFVRVTLEARDRVWHARPAGAQVSGHLVPQARAHALLIVPAADAALPEGADADALILRWPDAA